MPSESNHTEGSTSSDVVLEHAWIVELEDTGQIIETLPTRDEAFSLAGKLFDEGVCTVTIVHTMMKKASS